MRSFVYIALGAAAVTAAAVQRNIIFLLLDDQDLLLGGVTAAVMPNYVRRFRDEGMEMRNAFVASPKCCPSRTSLLSGRFAHRLNDTDLGWCGDFIAAARYNATFITQLKEAGYRTALFGKMTNSMGPMCQATPPHVPEGFDLAQGDAFVAMCNESAYYNITFNRNGALYTTGAAPADYLQAFIGNETLPWLARAAAAAASGGPPFFAYLALHSPHLPAQPAPWYEHAPLPGGAGAGAPRVASYNASAAGKLWALEENPPLGAFTAAGVDAHFRNRQRTLISVDDYVRDVFAALEAAGVLAETYVIATSDHGYHLGNFRLPFEKSTVYETDVRVPFFVRGPGVAAGAAAKGLVSLIDVGATVLELAGVLPPGARTTDGRSFVPVLAGGGGAPPPGWREAVLVEHLGEVTQWMTVCDKIYAAPGCGGPAPPPAGDDVPYLIDGPQNTWAMLRALNGTHDYAYAEFRPAGAPPARAHTNWTELYDLRQDPWQADNLARGAPPAELAPYRDALWAAANCSLAACP